MHFRFESKKELKSISHYALPLLTARFIAALAFVLVSASVSSQSQPVDLKLAEILLSEESSLAESNYGAYDQRWLEPLGDLARMSENNGDYEKALILFKQALHLLRINAGLYHESQIQIIDNIIAAEMTLQNWQEVDNYYSYLEHLYRRLYELDDPRLELGLQKVSSWHINAFNVNIDGKRIEHLRKVNQLFKIRMEIAKHTLSLDDPKFAMLAENIEICERELFLISDLSREMMTRRQGGPKRQGRTQRRQESRLVVSRD